MRPTGEPGSIRLRGDAPFLYSRRMPAPADIRVLPAHVANKIAAGEVVDRPASVAKELIENALDAGATQIRVEVSAGGRKLVAVTDNGHGMDRDNALLSIEAHATSKIRDVEDIEHIATLGFRGEALAAIAAVSRFTLQTCRAGQLTGSELRVHGGKLQDVRDTGGPAGTSIAARDLFFNVPARRKFLRTAQTELGHVRSVFFEQALANRRVGFTFVVDGREVHGLNSGGKLVDRLRELFGNDTFERLRPIAYERGGLHIGGYAGVPAAARPDRSEQYLFVNQRVAGAPLLGYAVREAYRTLLPQGRHPVLFLFIALDAGQVDVNVHPTKKEVRFRRPGEVRDAVIEALRAALRVGPPQGAVAAPADGATRPSLPPRPFAVATGALPINDLPPVRAFPYRRFRPQGDPTAAAETTPGNQATRPAAQNKAAPSPAARDAGAADTACSPWSWCRVLGQIGELYVVLETGDGLVLMDPHAAHERVLFERYMREVTGREVRTQGLLMPRTVEMTPRDSARLRKHLDLLRQMGFGISEFGAHTFVVDAVPAALPAVPVASVFMATLACLEQAGARGAQGRWREEAVAQAACKAAVKARDALQLEEIERLVADLAETEMPYTCPHGRPTLILTTFKELNRRFGREGQ